MNIKIEKAVPLPAKAHRGGRKAKYPFSRMEVGDSFVVDVRQSSILGCARAYAVRHPGVKFSTRQIDDKSCRIWRIA